eukprot:gene16727-biopygen6783
MPVPPPCPLMHPAQDTGAGMARAWRGLWAFFGLGWRGHGAGVARAWRGHDLFLLGQSQREGGSACPGARPPLQSRRTPGASVAPVNCSFFLAHWRRRSGAPKEPGSQFLFPSLRSRSPSLREGVKAPTQHGAGRAGARWGGRQRAGPHRPPQGSTPVCCEKMRIPRTTRW